MATAGKSRAPLPVPVRVVEHDEMGLHLAGQVDGSLEPSKGSFS